MMMKKMNKAGCPIWAEYYLRYLNAVYPELRMSSGAFKSKNGNYLKNEKGQLAGSSSEPIDFSGESGIINPGYHSNGCFIEDKKVTGFYLKKGAKHSHEFFDVGYTEKDGLKLQKDIASQFDTTKAYDKREHPNHTKTMCINMQLGVNAKKPFKTVWEKKASETEWRSITAFDISDHIKR